MVSLQISDPIFEELRRQMNGGREEQVAFLYASVSDERLIGTDLHVVPSAGFLAQSAYHLALTDDIRAEVLGRAAALDATLVEAHSHPGAHSACFSPTDLDGFEEWVPHIRWRLGGAPYVALVFAGEDLDALTWSGGDGKARALGLLEVGGRAVKPSNLTIRQLSRVDE